MPPSSFKIRVTPRFRDRFALKIRLVLLQVLTTFKLKIGLEVGLELVLDLVVTTAHIPEARRQQPPLPSKIWENKVASRSSSNQMPSSITSRSHLNT